MIPLPQELVDAIIDQVDEVTTVKSCTLVSGPFLSSAQRKLFRVARILAGRRNLSLADYSHFLSESPHIASYIRDLDIRAHPMTEPAALIHILAVVRNVECFTLTIVEMPKNNPAFTAALLDCVCRPTLRRLHLLYMQGVPSTILSAAMAVPAVSFWHISMDATEELPQSDFTPRIRQLSLLNSGSAVLDICNFLLHPRKLLYTTHIEYVQIRMDPDSASYDHRFLSACARTLKFLAIDPGALVDTINLPYLPFVLGVEIEIYIDHSRQLPRHFPSTLERLASSLPIVETITLSFVVEPLHPEFAWSDQGALPILGPSFKNRTEFLHLRRVHCKLRARNAASYKGPVFDRFVEAMEMKMSGLLGTEILTCAVVNPQPRFIAPLL
ncbi:hypothetical protein C8F04DRAFT_671817 [Mycena alexandri]|uniref:F-box domain-containing protein n=1 Tax=Mycena alexandri TaxID=1745969 RepID=A0AAD6SQT7_9AGAR|nr:hypothetical protein C8F04DRAFT_671817 [Mycena alexandri]